MRTPGSDSVILATAGDAVIVPVAGGSVPLPSAQALVHGAYARLGPDLTITAPDGTVYLIPDYFAADTPPDLTAPGHSLPGATVARLAGPMAPGQVAQAGTAGDAMEAPIGTVTKASGQVTVQRVDGTVVEVGPGDPVFQGDVVITAESSAVGIAFIDDSMFSLGAGGRMVLDEMVFDPASGDGSGSVTLVSGVFSFVSGHIAKAGTDAMAVNTPMATIGIRGTSGVIRVGQVDGDPDNQLQVILIPDPSGLTGEIIVISPTGEVTTVNMAFQGVNLRLGQISVFTTTAQDFIRDFHVEIDHLDSNFDTVLPPPPQPPGPDDQPVPPTDPQDPIKVILYDQEPPVPPTPRPLPPKKQDVIQTEPPVTAEPNDPAPTPEPTEAPVATVTVEGRVLDGYVIGAEVFLDANANGVRDAGEAHAVTDLTGSFSLTGAQGVLRALGGGSDLMTGATVHALSAPVGSTIISPLTDLVVMLQQRGLSLQAAQDRLSAALGMGFTGDGPNIGTFDPIAAILAEGGQAALGAQVMAAGVLVQNTVTMMTAALVGAGAPAAQAKAAAATALASALAQADGATLFDSPARLEAVLDAARARLPDITGGGLDSFDALKASIAHIVHELAEAFAAVPTDGAAGAVDVLIALGRIGIVAQIQAAEDIRSAVEAADPSALSGYTDTGIAHALAEAADRVGHPNGPITGGDGADHLSGSAFREIMMGGAGDDVLDGAGGDDILSGGDGDDTLDGGLGDDVLHGGAGADRFIANAGDDIIVDFSAAAGDHLRVAALGLDSWAAVKAAMVQDGANTVISTATGSLTLANVDAATLTHATFGFADTPATIGLTGASVTYVENGAGLAVDSGLTVSDHESATLAGARVSISGNFVAGQDMLTAAPPAGITYVYDAATGVLTLSGAASVADYQAALRSVAYHNTSDAPSTAPRTVTFQVNDGTQWSGASSTMQVHGVNDAPVTAATTSAATAEDASVSGVATATDADGDTLSWSVGAAGNGTVVVTDAATGAWTYTPSADFHGTDTFTLTVSDGNGGTATQAVTVTVSPVNDAPVFTSAASRTFAEDTSISGTLAATDVEGEALTFSLVTGPANGTLTAIDPVTGDWTYTPNLDFNGADSFTVRVSDGSGGTTTQTISLNVVAQNDLPIFISTASYSVVEEGTVIGTVVATDVDGDTLTFSLVSGPATGFTFNAATGDWSYTAPPDVNGTASFIVAVADGSGQTVEQTVEIVIAPVNDAPVITSTATHPTSEDVAVSAVPTATDADGDTLTWSVGAASNGTVTLGDAATGAWTYVPNADFNGTDSFTLMVSDGNGGITTQTVTIAVGAVNDAPVFASAATASLIEDTPYTGVLSATDVDGDTVTFAIGGGPANGTLSGFDAVTGAWTYTPDADYHGTDSFTVTASDGQGGTTSQTITLTIAPTNDAPVITSSSTVTTTEDTALSGTPTAIDAEGDTLTWSVGAAANGVVTMTNAATGAWTYTPNPDFNGTDTFTLAASDGNGGTASQAITVIVNAANDAPEARTTWTSSLAFTTTDGDYLHVPNAGDVLVGGGNSFTLMGWFRPTGGASLFHQYAYGGQLGFNATVSAAGDLTFALDAMSAGGWQYNTAASAVTLHEWNHLAFVKDGGTWRIVVNGTEVASGAVGTSQLAVGTSTHGNGLRIGESFGGWMTDLQVFHSGLTDATIGQWMFGVAPDADPSRAALRVHYGMVEGTGTTLSDLTGTGHDITFSGAAWDPAWSVEVPPLSVLESDTATGRIFASDIDGDTLTYTVSTQGALGTASVGADGIWIYRPTKGVTGLDSFDITVSDGNGGSVVKTITLTVADDPNVGTAGADVMTGTVAADTLVGAAGDDILSGLGGNDVLMGDGHGSAISSTFDVDADGWFVSGDGTDPTWYATGGQWDGTGHIRSTDANVGGSWFFDAPAKFLGNQAAYSGGDIAFSLRQVLASGLQYRDPNGDLQISNGPLTLVADFGAPQSSWTDYSVPLREGVWFVGSRTGALATQAEIDGVLSNLTFLRISADFVDGTDTMALDSVALTTGGNDTLVGGAGDDTLHGGAGVDVVDYGADGGPSGVNVRLDTTMSFDSWGNVDVLTGIEAVIGTEYADSMTASNWGNTLIGAGGNDNLIGGSGNDTLIGGAGADVLTGGAGSDIFVFETLSPTEFGDTITSFESGIDKFQFSAAALGLTAGTLPTANFVTIAVDTAKTGTEGSTAQPTFAYTSDTGNLYYDADGSGAGGYTLVADIQGTLPALVNTDIVLV